MLSTHLVILEIIFYFGGGRDEDISVMFWKVDILFYTHKLFIDEIMSEICFKIIGWWVSMWGYGENKMGHTF